MRLRTLDAVDYAFFTVIRKMPTVQAQSDRRPHGLLNILFLKWSLCNELFMNEIIILDRYPEPPPPPVIIPSWTSRDDVIYEHHLTSRSWQLSSRFLLSWIHSLVPCTAMKELINDPFYSENSGITRPSKQCKSLIWILIFVFPFLICYKKRRLWQLWQIFNYSGNFSSYRQCVITNALHSQYSSVTLL